MNIITWDNFGENMVQIRLQLINDDYCKTNFKTCRSQLDKCLDIWYSEDGKRFTIIEEESINEIIIQIPFYILRDYDGIDANLLKDLHDIEVGRSKYGT